MHTGGVESDNWQYDCSTVIGDVPTVRGALNNIAKWVTNDLTPFAPVDPGCTWSINCTPPCTNPTVPSVTATPNPICPGGSSTLTITGTLNDATAWHIYTGFCGVTPIGTTTGSTFVVSPSSNTSYYIRGEGGCVVPGTCGAVTVNVSTLAMTQASQTNVSCFGGSNGAASVNAATQVQNVVIMDNTAPLADLASLPDVMDECSVTSLTEPTATDNCSGIVTVTNDAMLPITVPGTTVVTWAYTDEAGNASTQYQNIIISGVDVSTSISTDGITITANAVANAYQWIECANNLSIVGETDQSFTATANGNYAVIITNGNCEDTSACVSINSVGFASLDLNRLSVYPNPTKDGHFMVSLEGEIESIELVDMLGREIPIEIDTHSGVVDASKLMNGRYIIRVTTNSAVLTTEIIIAQ